MIVRPARQEDIPAIVEIVERCGLKADDVDYSAWSGIVLVAMRQSEIVGFVHVLPARPYSIITHIAVLPEHRKGRAVVKLMESAELLLRHSGCGNWFTHVYEKDEALRESVRHWGAYEAPVPGYLYKRVL